MDVPLLESSPRYQIAMLLQVEHELSVSALADRLDLSVANVSQHLAKLRNAGLVEAVAEGHRYFYKIRADRAAEVAAKLANVTYYRKQAAEVDRKRAERAASGDA